MATTNTPADRSLTQAVNYLTTGRSARRLSRRWVEDPDLGGWTPRGLLDTLAQPDHPHHDQLVRGLLKHSHEPDGQDATTLLLAALRPAPWKLAHTYHRDRRHDAFDDLLVNAVHVIARADPTQDRLYTRLVGRIRVATPNTPPHRRERPTAQVDDRPDRGEDDLIDQLAAHDVLRRIAHLRRSGAIDDTTWSDLIAVRVHGTPTRQLSRGRSQHHVRADISRLSTRVQRALAT